MRVFPRPALLLAMLLALAYAAGPPSALASRPRQAHSYSKTTANGAFVFVMLLRSPYEDSQDQALLVGHLARR
jgi:hypothetical protein